MYILDMLAPIFYANVVTITKRIIAWLIFFFRIGCSRPTAVNNHVIALTSIGLVKRLMNSYLCLDFRISGNTKM